MRRRRAPARRRPPARGPPRRTRRADAPGRPLERRPARGRRRPTGDRSRAGSAELAEPLAPVEAEIYCALALGLRDYVEKNGFGHVVLGLSGGIDSALVACLAADALGAARVDVTIMPSPYSSDATQQDALRAGTALGVGVHELPIAEGDGRVRRRF